MKYKEPVLSQECKKELDEVRDVKLNRSDDEYKKAYKLWSDKWRKDISIFESLCLENISNFMILINKNPRSVELSEYFYKPGFSMSMNSFGEKEFVCDHHQAMQFPV